MSKITIKLEKSEASYSLRFTRSDGKFFRVPVNVEQLAELCSDIDAEINANKEPEVNIPNEIITGIKDLYETISKYNALDNQIQNNKQDEP